MKAEDLRLDELVSFDDGVLSFQGRRVVLHDMHAIARFRRDLVNSLGEKEARRILTRFGYLLGAQRCCRNEAGIRVGRA